MLKLRAYLPALGVSLLFAGSNIAARIITDSCLTATTIILIRMGLVILALGVFVRWRPFRQLAQHHLWSLLAAGGCNVVMNLGVFQALRYTSLTNFSIISATNPVLTALLTTLIYRTPWRWSTLAALGLSLLGVLIVVLGRADASLTALNRGDLIALGVAGIWAIYALIVRHISAVLEPHHVNFGTAVIAFGAVFSFSLLTGLDATLLAKLTWPELCAFGYLGLLGTALAYTLFTYSVRQVGPNLTALLAFSMTPLYTALLAWLLLGEALSWWQLAGGLLIVTAVGLAVRGQNGADF